MQTRRKFISNAAAVLAAALSTQSQAITQEADSRKTATKPLRKSLKLNMVKDGKSLAEKFAIARAAGFEGAELDAPGFNVQEANSAAKSTGLIIDGTVNVDHWNVRHSDPNPTVRATALKSCIDGLRATAAVGADTMLLVPGHGKDGAAEEVFARTLDNIRQAIPIAKEVNVKIAIENVWNHFLYDHEGGNDQTADALARYIDAFDSPWIGVQFDIGNHWKYGDPAEWIRTLGKRIIKLDVKGYSRSNDAWTQMAQSDMDWAEIRKALDEIKFTGWVAAEMASGDVEYLKQVSKEMDDLLILG